ncbi:MAG: S8 family serine peptidase [Blastocatellia bacterium]
MIICLLVAVTLAAPAAHPSRAAASDRVPQELEEFQGYLDPAPFGMDVRYAWTLPGGKGENVKIVDIELNWNLNHNDLIAAASDAFILVKGMDSLPDTVQNDANINHGTAVLGELVAADDGIGVTGIAHRARLGLVNPLTSGTKPDVAAAIRRAGSKLEPGDVMLIELSVAGPRFDPFAGRGLVPVEFEPDVFAAIKEATSNGVIVVESAGNGFEDLDHPAYGGAFNRNNRDSGAIIVGAGKPEGGIYGLGPDRARTEESNFGSRVDLQGWGRFVTTCGYGPLRQEQGQNHLYTIDFSATSAATAMVAGAAAVLQSIVKERGRAPLTADEMRLLLVSTGTRQSGNINERIGPRPDLRAAIEGLDSDGADPAITRVKLKNGGAKLVVDGARFTTGDSIIEIDGTAVTKLKYPAEFRLPNGQTTRLVTKGDISGLMPKSVQVAIVVFTPSSGRRSEPFLFTP